MLDVKTRIFNGSDSPMKHLALKRTMANSREILLFVWPSYSEGLG